MTNRRVMFRARLLLVGVFATAFVVRPVVARQTVPTFDELVSEAGSIVLTEVLDTSSRWHQLNGRRVIVTDVRLRVDRILKGRADGVTTLTLLGGMVGDVTQQVAGMPHFLVGDNDVLFLAAQRTLVSPIVGMGHGRFRVVTGHTGAGRYIANSARQPILTLSTYARPAKLAADQRAVTLDELVALISARLQR